MGTETVLDRDDVVIDVGLAIAKMVESRGLAYSPDLVPEKDPNDGLGADDAGWLALLLVVQDKLHNQRKEYKVLDVNASDARATISKPLRQTRKRLANKIINENKRLRKLAKEGV